MEQYLINFKLHQSVLDSVDFVGQELMLVDIEMTRCLGYFTITLVNQLSDTPAFHDPGIEVSSPGPPAQTSSRKRASSPAISDPGRKQQKLSAAVNPRKVSPKQAIVRAEPDGLQSKLVPAIS